MRKKKCALQLACQMKRAFLPGLFGFCMELPCPLRGPPPSPLAALSETPPTGASSGPPLPCRLHQRAPLPLGTLGSPTPWGGPSDAPPPWGLHQRAPLLLGLRRIGFFGPSARDRRIALRVIDLMMLPFIFLCGHRRISQAGKLPGWENLIVSIEFLGTRLFEGPIF